MAPNPPINWGFLAPNSGKTELLACPKELRRWEAPQQGISSPSLPDFFGREAGRTGGATQGAKPPPALPRFLSVSAKHTRLVRGQFEPKLRIAKSQGEFLAHQKP